MILKKLKLKQLQINQLNGKKNSMALFKSRYYFFVPSSLSKTSYSSQLSMFAIYAYFFIHKHRFILIHKKNLGFTSYSSKVSLFIYAFSLKSIFSKTKRSFNNVTMTFVFGITRPAIISFANGVSTSFVKKRFNGRAP